MAKIVSKKHIPECGDIVESVKYNKARTFGCVIFDSGKQVFFDCDPVEFGKKKQYVHETVIRPSTPSSPRTVNEMDKNTPNDARYQAQVIATLAKMRGVLPEIVREEMAVGQNSGASMVVGSEPTEPTEDFEERNMAILDGSEARSRMLAEQLSREHGGRLESTFGGKNSVSM